MLTFLKIIGTILLVILLVILALLLLVLFVPFRYNMEFVYNKDNLYLKAKVTWLLMFRFYLNFIEKKLAYKFKILFLTILNSEKTKNTPLADKKVPAADTSSLISVKEQDIKTEEVEEKQNEEQEKVVREVEEAVEQHKSTSEDTGKTKKRFSFKLLHPAEIYYNISQKIVDIFWKIRDAILTTERKLDKICAMIADPDNREAVVFVLRQVKTLLKHIAPTKHGIYVKAGFDNPATTGQVLGAYSVVNNILRLNFVLEPDFENEVLESKVFVKGRIRVVNLLIIGIKVITNKTIRKFIRRK